MLKRFVNVFIILPFLLFVKGFLKKSKKRRAEREKTNPAFCSYKKSILVLFVVGFVLEVLVLVEKCLFSLVNVIGGARLADEIVFLVVYSV